MNKEQWNHLHVIMILQLFCAMCLGFSYHSIITNIPFFAVTWLFVGFGFFYLALSSYIKFLKNWYKSRKTSKKTM